MKGRRMHPLTKMIQLSLQHARSQLCSMPALHAQQQAHGGIPRLMGLFLGVSFPSPSGRWPQLESAYVCCASG